MFFCPIAFATQLYTGMGKSLKAKTIQDFLHLLGVFALLCFGCVGFFGVVSMCFFFTELCRNPNHDMDTFFPEKQEQVLYLKWNKLWSVTNLQS